MEIFFTTMEEEISDVILFLSFILLELLKNFVHVIVEVFCWRFSEWWSKADQVLKLAKCVDIFFNLECLETSHGVTNDCELFIFVIVMGHCGSNGCFVVLAEIIEKWFWKGCRSQIHFESERS